MDILGYTDFQGQPIAREEYTIKKKLLNSQMKNTDCLKETQGIFWVSYFKTKMANCALTKYVAATSENCVHACLWG